MFNFLKRLVGARRKEIVDPDATPEEYWQTNFRKPARARFTGEKGDSYAAELTPDGLSLTFDKKNVYAWTVDPLYRYRDFVLESLIEFPGRKGKIASSNATGVTPLPMEGSAASAGSMSAGFLFRYLNESTFYSVLLSDEGMIRMDAVVNGTPVSVLGWTETRQSEAGDIEEGDEKPPYVKDPSVFSLRIISQATNITVIVNDNWIASCTDDTIQAAGRIAFAGQNWNASDRAEAILRIVAVDSRPIEVETINTRWNQYIRIPPEAHINLARTWYAMGKNVPAIIELKRAWKNRKPGTEDMLLLGQVYLAQRLLPEAEEQIRKVIEIDGSNEQAYAELGGILYLQNRFVELEDLLRTVSRAAIDNSSFLSNLEGHLLLWKGEHARSAAAYHRAGSLAPDQGLFFLHEGNEWKAANEPAKALEAWLESARLFLSDESYDDLSDIIPLLEKAGPEDARVAAIAGKYYYATGRENEAAIQFEKAIGNGTADSAVWYLSGMLKSSKNKTAEAIGELSRAVELEPGYGPYRFRLAETLFFAGEKCDKELALALEKNPGNGWVYNLAALKALGENDARKARDFILEARRLLPDELPVLVNYAEISRQEGKLDEVLPLLDTDDPDSLRAGANLLVEDKRYEEAEDWYIKALRRRPFDAELLTDRAANCLEIDLLNEADDLLGRAIDIESSPRIYQLISYLGGKKGEYTRSEVALLKGLEEFPGNADLLHELAEIYLVTNRPGKAADTAKRFAEAEKSDRVAALEEDIADATTTRLSCADCGRTWRVPKDIQAQGSLHLRAEPPDDLPAGTCPACQLTFCIGCAKEKLGEDGRFRCKRCGTPLKLIDQNVVWLLNEWQKTI